VPPRYAYWTIIAGGLPTAFRAADREELLPTFQRLREKHPDAQMKWFARGKLWSSPEEARREAERQRRAPSGGRPGARSDRRTQTPPRGPREDRRPPHGGREDRRAPSARTGEVRGRDWRPGGDHRDPRQKYVDAKKARNLDRRRERFERKHARPDGSREAAGTGGRPRPPRTDERRGAHTPERPRDRRAGEWKTPGFRPPKAGAHVGARGQGPRRDRPAPRPPGGFEPQGAGGRSGGGRNHRRDRDAARQPAPPRYPKGPASQRRDDRREQVRPFDRGGFARGQQQGTEEPRPPKRPRGPNREPRPSENPEPTPPPRPSEPAIMPPGPPERGRRERPDES
jgi:hypothetical protein